MSYKAIEITTARGKTEVRTMCAGCGMLTYYHPLRITKELASLFKYPTRGLSRTKMLVAAGGKCVKCGSQERLEVDHKTPIKLGGSNEPENLQILCHRCHKRKHGKGSISEIRAP